MSSLVEQTTRHVCYATRLLRRTPTFTAAITITLAIGIGVNCAVFSVVNAVLLESLPAPRAERLFVIESATKDGNFEPLSDEEYEQYRVQSRSFQGLSSYRCGITNLANSRDVTVVRRCQVPSDFWNAMAVRPKAGTVFEGSPATASGTGIVVSERFWLSRLNGDVRVLGRNVMLDGANYVVIGVMPRDFDFPWRADVWSPRISADVRIASHGVVGRLKENVTVDRAQSELQVICRRIASLVSPEDPPERVRMVPMRDFISGHVRKPLLLLFGAAGLILLICCANAANLELAGALSRHREVAIRVALGAGRLTLLWQLVVESVVQAFLGGTLGFFLGWCMVKSLLPLLVASGMPRATSIHLDLHLFAFTAILSLVTGLLFGVLPALEVTRGGSGGVLHAATRSSPLRNTTRELLAASEVALALLLLICSSLLVKSLARLHSVDPGFDTKNRLAMTLFFPDDRTSEQLRNFDRELLYRIRNLPVVDSVAVVNWLPFGHALVEGTYWANAAATAPASVVACRVGMSADYFRILGMRLLKGRSFEDRDDETSAPVAIVSRSLAQRFWPNMDPIGQRVTSVANPNPQQWSTVVGVVEDVKQQDLSQPPPLAVYEPFFQLKDPIYFAHTVYVVRYPASRELVATEMMIAVHQLDKSQPVYAVDSLEKLISDSMLRSRLYASAMAVYSFVGLILAMTGVYGVLRLVALQRTREIAIRIALGAQRRDITFLVLLSSMKSVFLGVACGLASAVAITRLLRNQLFEVSPLDVATFMTTSAVLIMVSLLASYLPARRASRVDPISALGEA